MHDVNARRLSYHHGRTDCTVLKQAWMRTGTILLPFLAAFACISHSNGNYNTFRSDRHYFLYSLLRTIPYSGPAQGTVQPRVTLPDLPVSDLARRLLLTKCCGMTWVPVPRLLTN